jgi:hypothetical protein
MGQANSAQMVTFVIWSSNWELAKVHLYVTLCS